MRHRTAGLVLGALVLLLILAALLPLAYATPPDPTWIVGFWDDGDHDDIIFLVTSGISAVEPRLPLCRRLVQAVITPPNIGDERPYSSAHSSALTRAPPARRLAD